MSDSNLYVSNGDCYYGEGQISDPRFIPCGNAELSGTQSCCFQGDFCLASSVCYDNDTAVTYISGCTDATFSSSKCPHKPGYPDQQWVALARCDGADIDLFSGCGHHKNETQIKHEDCTCDPASALISNPAHGQPTLNQIALLPPTAGGTISFNPTALPTATSDSGSDGGGGGGGGLSSSAKIGVGVGVGVGVPLLAGLILALFLLWRRKQKKARAEQEQEQQQQQHPPMEGPDRGSVATATTAAGHRSPPPTYDFQGGPHDQEQQQQQQQQAVPGWLGGYKSELHAESAHKSELPAGDDYGAHGKETMNSVQNTPHGLYPPSELGGR